MVEKESVTKIKQIPAGEFDKHEKDFAVGRMLDGLKKDLLDFGVASYRHLHLVAVKFE